MSEKAAIVLVDSAATPESPGTPGAANRTFTPGEMENGYVHTFYNTTTGTTPGTRSKMTVSISNGAAVSRVKINIATPKSVTVDGVVKADHVTRGFIEFIFPVNCSRDDRRDIASLLYNSLADATIVNMIHNLEDLW